MCLKVFHYIVPELYSITFICQKWLALCAFNLQTNKDHIQCYCANAHMIKMPPVFIYLLLIYLSLNNRPCTTAVGERRFMYADSLVWHCHQDKLVIIQYKSLVYCPEPFPRAATLSVGASKQMTKLQSFVWLCCCSVPSLWVSGFTMMHVTVRGSLFQRRWYSTRLTNVLCVNVSLYLTACWRDYGMNAFVHSTITSSV